MIWFIGIVFTILIVVIIATAVVQEISIHKHGDPDDPWREP